MVLALAVEFLEGIHAKLCQHYEEESKYVRKFENFESELLKLVLIQAQANPADEKYNLIRH